jgi:hypothetical protein
MHVLTTVELLGRAKFGASDSEESPRLERRVADNVLWHPFFHHTADMMWSDRLPMQRLALALALGVFTSIAAHAEPSPWHTREVYKGKVERAGKAGDPPSTVSRSHVESCERHKLSPKMCAILGR